MSAESHQRWVQVLQHELADKAGVASTAELRSDRERFLRAIPVLLDLLPRIESDSLKIGIINDLRHEWAKGIVAGPLIDEFLRLRGLAAAGVKWQIASALVDVADRAVWDRIAELWLDRRHGTARQMLAGALVTSKHPQAAHLLVQCLDDKNVRPHAINALGKLKTVEYRDAVAAFLDSDDAPVRREARLALERMDRVAAKARAMPQVTVPRVPQAINVAPPLRLSSVTRQAEVEALAEYQVEVDPQQAARVVEKILRAVGHKQARAATLAIDADVLAAEVKDTATYSFAPGTDSVNERLLMHWYLGDPDVLELSAYAPPHAVRQITR